MGYFGEVGLVKEKENSNIIVQTKKGSNEEKKGLNKAGSMA